MTADKALKVGDMTFIYFGAGLFPSSQRSVSGFSTILFLSTVHIVCVLQCWCIIDMICSSDQVHL